MCFLLSLSPFFFVVVDTSSSLGFYKLPSSLSLSLFSFEVVSLCVFYFDLIFLV